MPLGCTEHNLNMYCAIQGSHRKAASVYIYTSRAVEYSASENVTRVFCCKAYISFYTLILQSCCSASSSISLQISPDHGENFNDKAQQRSWKWSRWSKVSGSICILCSDIFLDNLEVFNHHSVCKRVVSFANDTRYHFLKIQMDRYQDPFRYPLQIWGININKLHCDI